MGLEVALPGRIEDGLTGLSPEFEALRWFPLPPGCLPAQSGDAAVQCWHRLPLEPAGHPAISQDQSPWAAYTPRGMYADSWGFGLTWPLPRLVC
jgi:hypothetical protein